MKRTTYQILVGLAFIFVLAGASTNAQKAELVVQTGHTSSVKSVAFSPDGKMLASGSWDKTIKLWDLKTGKELKTLSGHKSRVSTVRFSPNGKVLASSEVFKNTINLWDVKTGGILRLLSGHKASVHSVTFSPDGKMLASGSFDRTIKLWETRTGAELKSFSGQGSIFFGDAIAILPDGQTLASVDMDGTIKLFNLSSGQALKTLKGHTSHVGSVAFSRDGKTLASGSDNTIKLRDITTGQELKTLSGHQSTVISVAFSPDGNMLASSENEKRTIRLWDVQTGRLLKTFNGSRGPVVFSPHDAILASADFNTLKLWDLQTGEILRTLSGHASPVDSVTFSPDGKMLASEGKLNTIKLWDMQTGKEMKTLRVQTNAPFDQVSTIRFSPDGKMLASGNQNGSIKLWDVLSGQEIRELSQNAGFLVAFGFSPDGRILESHSDGEIKLWNVQTGKELNIQTGHTEYIHSVVFSADGRMLASGSEDKTVKLWDVASGRELKTLGGHTHDVVSISFSPDRRLLAAGVGDPGGDFGGGDSKRDNTITLWDIESGEKLKTLKGHTSYVVSVAFSSDGKTLASGGQDGTVRIWDTASGRLLKTFQEDDQKTVRQVSALVPDYYRNRTDEPITQDGRLQIKIRDHRTLDLYNVRSGRLLASLIALDENDWAVVTPDGRFDASPNAEKLMHYVIGLEPIDLEQIKDRYYTPNLLQRIFKGEDLDSTRKVSPFTSDELYPTAKYKPLKEGETTLTIKLSNRGGGIGPVQLFVNGTEFLSDARPVGFDPKARQATLKVDLSKANFIPGEKNDIKIITRNESGWLRSRGSDVIYLDTRKKSNNPQEFYAIVGGVSDYEETRLNLRYSAKDARDFAKALELGAVRLFGKDKVHIRLLASGAEKDSKVLSETDSKHFAPTKQNFHKAFKEFQTAKPSDIFVVYLAGHGTSINKGGDTGDTYLYLTKEAVTTDKFRLRDEKLRQSTTISSEELADWIRDVPALKRAMILDTCAAGAVEASLVKPRDLSPDQIKALERMKDRTGFFVLMGSAADRVSYEATRYGQGLLTYSLLQAMSGAKLRNGEYADVRTLFSYAEDTVVGMAKGIGGIQQPRIIAPTESRSFDIGQFTNEEKSKFTLAKLKPLILRPTMINKGLGFDNQKFGSMLTKALRDENITTGRGNEEVKLVFVDAVEMPDAITPVGTYEVNGDQIKLTLILVKNNNPVKTLIVEGTLKNKEELSQKIVKAIIENAREIEKQKNR